MVPRLTDVSIQAESLGKALREKGLTLAVAESCTGGMLGAAVTSVSGSSAYFVGGVIAYSNDVKTRLLDVDEATLDEHGAVSPETARQMAVGARQATGADIGVSVTGIAGPGGGSRRKPVGTVFIGVSASTGPDVPEASVVGEYHFAGTRESIREQTVAAALTAALNTLCD